MRAHPTLAALEPFEIMSKRVADFLRYQQTANVNNEPDLPQQRGHKRVAEWVSSASTGTSSMEPWRTTWSKEDHNTILEWLAGQSKCPRKAEVQMAFETDKKLKNILEQKTLQQCLNKVKNLAKTMKATQKL